MKKVQTILFLFFLLVPFACKQEKEVNVDDINLMIHAKRFEKDLFSLNIDSLKPGIEMLRQKYGAFFSLFNYKIINIGGSGTPAYPEYLKRFLTDYTINQAWEATQIVFNDFTSLNNKITNGFKHYKYYFPAGQVPAVYTYISGFNQSMVTADSILGIGIDKYLGPENELYKRMGLPSYVRYNMRRERIPVDCMRAWGMSEFVYNDSVDNVLSNMIYQGKILYYTKKMLPEESDTLIFGYTPQQLSWCKANEEKMWTSLVEEKRLFQTDMLTIAKFIKPAPFTKGFSNNSPGQAAIWIGYRIVEKYMQRKNNVTLPELMQNDNFQQILEESRYDP